MTHPRRPVTPSQVEGHVDHADGDGMRRLAPPWTGAAFAARLRQAMGARTIEAVAEAAGIARPGLSKMLAGRSKRGPYPDTLVSLARVLQVRASWLAFGEVEYG